MTLSSIATAGRLLAVAVLAVGCSGEDPSTDEGVSQSVHIPLFPLTDETRETHGLQLRGELQVDGPCLVVNERGKVWHVAWPSPDTRWDPHSRTIRVGESVATVGGPVALIGGESQVTAENVGRYRWAMRPDPACLDGPFWFAQTIETGPPP